MPLAALALEGTTALLAAVLGALAAVTTAHRRDRARDRDRAEVSDLALNVDTGAGARQALCDEARALTGADAVQLQECDAQGDFTTGASSGEAPLLDGRPVRTASGVSAAIAAEPIRDGRRTLGMLLFVWRDDSRRGGARDRRLAGLFADRAASVLMRAAHEERLDRLAYLDGLTGLPNRRSLDEQLPRELARAERDDRPLSVAILDLDRFKAYNDTHGHPAGDRLLKRVAAGLAGSMRASDFCARYGGEEFALVMPSCTTESAREAIDRMRTAMPADQTYSAGVATWDGLETIDGLLKRADAALYQAKDAGRARTVAAA